MKNINSLFRHILVVFICLSSSISAMDIKFEDMTQQGLKDIRIGLITAMSGTRFIRLDNLGEKNFTSYKETDYPEAIKFVMSKYSEEFKIKFREFIYENFIKGLSEGERYPSDLIIYNILGKELGVS